MLKNDVKILVRFGLQDEKEIFIKDNDIWYMNQADQEGFSLENNEVNRKEVFKRVINTLDIDEVEKWFAEKCPAVSDEEINTYFNNELNVIRDWILTYELNEVNQSIYTGDFVKNDVFVPHFAPVGGYSVDEFGSGEPEVHEPDVISEEEYREVMNDLYPPKDGVTVLRSVSRNNISEMGEKHYAVCLYDEKNSPVSIIVNKSDVVFDTDSDAYADVVLPSTSEKVLAKYGDESVYVSADVKELQRMHENSLNSLSDYKARMSNTSKDNETDDVDYGIDVFA